MNTPLSKEQAIKIASDFKNLIGTKFIEMDIEYTIHYACPSPFNEQMKQAFAQRLKGDVTQYPAEELADFITTEFDVIVFSQNLKHGTIHILDIRNYIKDNDLPYSFS